MTKIYQKRGLDRKTNNTPVAKCGHPSTTRYFKCEVCLPELPSDNDFLYLGNEGEEEVENEFEGEDKIDLGCWE